MTKNVREKSGVFKNACSRWIATCVDVFEHPVLDKGPYDRRSAWLWMIANAAWKDKTVNHKGRPLELKRGQLIAGRAFLAETWGWSEQNVRTFISLLVANGMLEINQSGGHYANVVSVSNYEAYQSTKENGDQSSNQSLTSVQPEPNQTCTKTTSYTIKDSGETREREEANRLAREAYERGLAIKGGKTAKSARAVQRTKGELDGSAGITLENGKLIVVNGSAATLVSEFPGIDLAAVCNRAAPELMRCNYPTRDDAMAVLRKWAQIAQETAGKPAQKAAEPDFAAMTKGTVRHAKPAPGSVMFPEVHGA